MSKEKYALCPQCDSPLEYHCRVIRPLKNAAGEKNNYSIRVLKCCNEACPRKYHRELPDIIIPYKRHDAATIEEAIEKEEKDMAVEADFSTVSRWKSWFAKEQTYIMMSLVGVAIALGYDVDLTLLMGIPTIQIIKRLVNRGTGWLQEAARILVNSARWKTG